MERKIHLKPLEKKFLFGFRKKSIADRERLEDFLKNFCEKEMNKYSNVIQYKIYDMSFNGLSLSVFGDKYDFDHILHAISDSGYAVIKDEIIGR